MTYELNDDDIVDFGFARGRRLRMALPWRHDFIQSTMRKQGRLWLQGELEWALKYIPFDPHVVDVGSYTGSSAVWFAAVAGAKGVTAIEPDPFSYSLLEANVRLNGLEGKVRTVHSAVWSECGRACMELDPVGNHGAAAYGPCPRDVEWSVPMVNLDSILADRKDKVDVLFISMEGNDYHAIDGARETISKDRPIMLITTFPGNSCRADRRYDGLTGQVKLMNALAGLGYSNAGSFYDTTAYLPS